MKKLLILITVALVLNIQGFAQEHDHHKAKKSEVSAKMMPGTRFTSDKELSPRMETILNTMKSLHGKGKKTTEVKEGGKKIEQTVNDIFKNCKLEPAADEALHPVLGDILAGAELLKQGNYKDGHEKVHHALLKYEELFSHQGWDH